MPEPDLPWGQVSVPRSGSETILRVVSMGIPTETLAQGGVVCGDVGDLRASFNTASDAVLLMAPG